MEKGNFEEKSEYCFKLADNLGIGVLDYHTLRFVLKKSYADPIVKLEEAT
jgi:hypothetical protein